MIVLIFKEYRFTSERDRLVFISKISLLIYFENHFEDYFS